VRQPPPAHRAGGGGGLAEKASQGRSRARPQRPRHPSGGELRGPRAVGGMNREAQQRRAARTSQAPAVPQHLFLIGGPQRRRPVLHPSSVSRGMPSWPRCAGAREERTPLRGCAAIIGEANAAWTWRLCITEGTVRQKRTSDGRSIEIWCMEARGRLPVLPPVRHLAGAQALTREGPLQIADARPAFRSGRCDVNGMGYRTTQRLEITMSNRTE
jgi:hypothetical protein